MAAPVRSALMGKMTLPQGHIWAGGFAKGELRSQLFADVPDALTVWRDLGIRTYIYSSGSRCGS